MNTERLTLKARVYDILVDTRDDEVADRIVAIGLMILIVVNVIAVVLETVEEYAVAYATVFHTIEYVSVTVFTIEYLLRVWVAKLGTKFNGRYGRLKYIVSPLALVDLLAILPAFLPFFITVDLRILRFLRVLRLFRLLKLSRYVDSLDKLDDVIMAKRSELFVILVVIAILLLFSSSLMYVFEHEAQPDKFPSIPAAMWWGVATLTTVGYGDVYPITPIGKFLGTVIAFLGVGIFALPSGILASGFAEHLANHRQQHHGCCCPRCGCDLSDKFVPKETMDAIATNPDSSTTG